jgi:hypothetical protein
LYQYAEGIHAEPFENEANKGVDGIFVDFSSNFPIIIQTGLYLIK